MKIKKKKDRLMVRFYVSIGGMLFALLLPWGLGFLSTLGEMDDPFFVIYFISNSISCLLFSLPICIALMYLIYTSFRQSEPFFKDKNSEEKTGICESGTKNPLVKTA